MVTQVKRPPCGRDFEAYRLVKVQGESTRQAAEFLQLSQTRICQMVQRVATFMNETAPAVVGQEDSAGQRAQRLGVAEQVAAARVDHLYGCALQAWGASQGTQTISRELSQGRGTVKARTIRKSVGEVRYLMAAGKLAMLGATLPPSMLSYGGTDFDVADDELDEGANDMLPNHEAAAPPQEACSPAVLPTPKPIAATTTRERVSLFADESCEQLLEIDELLAQRFSAPVQLAAMDADAEEVAPSNADRPLNRTERRARKRLLERKLRKAK